MEIDGMLKGILEKLVRIGTVTALDPARRRARVRYDDMDMSSGWLFVLQRYGENIRVMPDGRHTHNITDTYTGGGSASTEPNHDHPDTHVTTYMPRMGERVVVLYLPIFNGDGFVLGGL